MTKTSTPLAVCTRFRYNIIPLSKKTPLMEIRNHLTKQNSSERLDQDYKSTVMIDIAAHLSSHSSILINMTEKYGREFNKFNFPKGQRSHTA